MAATASLLAKTDFILEAVRERLRYPYEGFEPTPHGWLNAAFFYGRAPQLSLLAGKDHSLIEGMHSPRVVFADLFIVAMERLDTPAIDTVLFQDTVSAAYASFSMPIDEAVAVNPQIRRILFECKRRSFADSIDELIDAHLHPVVQELGGRMVIPPGDGNMNQPELEVSVDSLSKHAQLFFECEVQFERPRDEVDVIRTVRKHARSCPDSILGKIVHLDLGDNNQTICRIKARAY
jgi:hypothetical protein